LLVKVDGVGCLGALPLSYIGNGYVCGCCV
jgi:hypothetical protein